MAARVPRTPGARHGVAIMAWAEPLEREGWLGRRLTPVGSRLNGPC